MPDAEGVREELREIGERRKDHDEDTQRLREDTAKAIKRARGIVSMGEIASLIGIDRTGLYRTYGGR